jgi:hypothetical protein
LAWFGSEHAHGAQAIAFARNQRRAGIKPDAAACQDRMPILFVRHQVWNDQRAASIGHFAARSQFARDFPMVNPDAGLEPLPIGVGQGHGRNRKVENLRRHPGNPVEAFARGSIEEVKGPQGVQSFGFVGHGSDRVYLTLCYQTRPNGQLSDAVKICSTDF